MINREKKFKLFEKRMMETTSGEQVEIAIPIGEFSIEELEQQMGMFYNDKARAEERIKFFESQIQLIIEEQTKNTETKPELENNNK